MVGGNTLEQKLSGLAPVELVVIQKTDGSYEAVDSLKSTFSCVVHTGKNIFKNSFDEILKHELIGARLDRVKQTCVILVHHAI